jgi:3-oxoacyl-[acyl-carrier-protein] synthase-3
MRFQSTRLAGLAYELPERRVTSLEIEERLAPVYQRLGLSPGRLELFSGIRERRAFERGTRPSAIAARAATKALAASNIAREEIGALVHASVCRDFLEPATANVVHRLLVLAPRCQAFDLSNACLGFANAMTVVAGMIERGEVEAGLVVAGEDGGPLVDATIAALLAGPGATRAELKRAFASLTIGAGAAACVLAHERLAPRAPRLVGGVSLVASEHVELCRGDFAPDARGPLMETDSEALLAEGCELAARTFAEFLEVTGWQRESIGRTVTHQVGSAHRRLLLGTLGLDPARDLATYPEFGNVGTVSLPLSLALARERGLVRPGERTALLGIGSGLACLMLGLE